MDGAWVKMQNLSLVCYLFIYSLFLLYLFSFAAKLHVQELTMARLPSYTRTPASMAAYDDPPNITLVPTTPLFLKISRSRALGLFVCFLFVFWGFYLFNEMHTSTNPLTDEEELWRLIVVWSLWTCGMLFYRIFFFLIGVFWADISLMYIGLPRECQGLTLGFGGFLWFFQGFLNNKPNFRSNVIFYRD